MAPTPQARAALARRAGRWVLMPSSSQLLLLSQWEGPEVPTIDSAERAVMMGEVGGVGLLDLLGLFNQTRRSLRIVVSRGRVERAILLRDGDIGSVASSDPRDRLGEFLVRIGKLTEARLKESLSTAQAGGRKLGQHLVATGVLSSHELWGAIQQQIMEIICDVVAWSEGSYVVFNLPPGFSFPQTPPLPTQALVLEAVRRADEMGLYRAKVPSFDAMVSATGKVPQDAGPTELNALQALTRPTSVRELAQRLQRGEFDATKVVYNLIKQGCLRMVDEGPPAVFGVPVSAPSAAVAPLPQGQVLPTPDLTAVLQVFATALREIDHELFRRNVADAYRRGLNAFLTDPQNAYAAVFAGVALGHDGMPDLGRVGANAEQSAPQDPARSAQDALNELTFFALFQASELLPQDADEDLARRVRTLLAELPQR